MSSGASSPSSPPVPPPRHTMDEAKMTPEDHAFSAFAKRQVSMKCGGGALLGAGAYALVRKANGSRVQRVGAALLTSLGGITGGLVWATRSITRELDALPPNSQFKIFASKVLMERYPMAAAEELENRRQAREAASGTNK